MRGKEQHLECKSNFNTNGSQLENLHHVKRRSMHRNICACVCLLARTFTTTMASTKNSVYLIKQMHIQVDIHTVIQCTCDLAFANGIEFVVAINRVSTLTEGPSGGAIVFCCSS